jgi:hypothetical protein
VVTLGDGPMRLAWSQDGAFTDDLIVVSGAEFYRKPSTGAATLVEGEVRGTGDVSAAVVSTATRRRLFIADGTLLQYYEGGTNASGELTADIGDTPEVWYQILKIGSLYYGWGHEDKKARAVLTSTGTFGNNETVTITGPAGAKVYTFKTVLTGVANEVLIGASAAASHTNLTAAINATAGAGTTYGTGTVANVDVTAETVGTTMTRVTSILPGMAVNHILVADTVTNASWGTSSLNGGGDVDKRATGILTMGTNPTAAQTVSIGFVAGVARVYTFGSGTPSVDGDVLIGATAAESLDNLMNAINLGPGSGTTYFASAANEDATAVKQTDTKLLVTAISAESDVGGRKVPVATNVTAAAWTAASLTNAQAGTALNPFLAKAGATNELSLANMAKLLNFTGTPGTDISAAVTAADPNVSATSTALTLVVTSRNPGGTNVATTVDDPDSYLAWGAAVLVLTPPATNGVGTLTLSPLSIEDDVIEIGGTHYSFGDVTTSGQDGSAGAPWLAPIGSSVLGSLANLVKVINYEGVPGEDFSDDLTGPNLAVTAAMDEDDEEVLVITAKSEETDGNAISTTLETDTSGILSWGAATLTGGGVHVLHGVEVPGGAAPRAVVSIAGFVVVVIGDSQRFYWLRPGEIEIDPLDFASAEFAPDNLTDAIAVADQLWLAGGSSIEVWYVTGVLDSPFQPVAGRAFANGVVESTLARVRDTVLFVGKDMRVYSMGGNHLYYTQGGQMQPISTHAIEERIRTQLAREAAEE